MNMIKKINKKNFHGHPIVTSLTVATLLFCFIMLIFDDTVFKFTPQAPMYFMLSWLLAAIFFSLFAFKEFVSGFLLSAFCMMISWRIAAIYGILNVTLPLAVAFIFLLSNFIYCACKNLRAPQQYKYPLSIYVWQLVFIRIYLGLDFIPHFTEKLFAGTAPRVADINAFIHLGIPHPEFFVYLAGLCEFGAAVALCLGFLMRFGGVGAALYLIIATYLGHHFLDGFIWVGPGGGWEFAVMWIILILSFAVTGANAFSVDQVLIRKFNIPHWLKRLM
jgi:putative oxidoreductase